MRAACVLLFCLLPAIALAAPLPTHFDEDRLSDLHPPGWNFQSRDDANIRTYLNAVTVTEYEGPFVVKDKLLAQLLRAGVPADNYYGCRVLAAAAHTRNIVAVRKLLAAHAPVQSSPTRESRDKGWNDCDALAEGLHGGSPAIVALLLKQYPDVNTPGEGGLVPLANIPDSPAYVPGDGPPHGVAAQAKWRAERDHNMAVLLRLMLAAGADPRRNASSTNPYPVEKMFRLRNMTQTQAVLDAWPAAHPSKAH